MYRVLLSVYACEPGHGSERGVGWTWVNELAKDHEIYAVTRANNKEIILNNPDLYKKENIHWIFFDLPKWASFWKKGPKGMRTYYFLWQFFLYFKIKKFINLNSIDIIQHLTFGNYWLPSFLPLLHKPFIWGPVGGAEKLPLTFWKCLSSKNIIYELFRSIIPLILENLFFAKMNAKRSILALAKSKESYSRLKKLGASNVILFSEVGLKENEIPKSEMIPDISEKKIISVGRLIHIKGYDLAIEALAKIKNEIAPFKYEIYGEGPELENLQKLIMENGLAHEIIFKGHQSRHIVFNALANSHLIVHPSLHDSGGWALLEAMAVACPVICLDVGGPAVQVTMETGFKIAVNNRSQVINDLSKKIKIYFSENHYRDMRPKCIEHINNNYLWGAKRKNINELYRKAIEDYENRH
jgi:glycosyltransferase involved in cell wall biosynthesis